MSRSDAACALRRRLVGVAVASGVAACATAPPGGEPAAVAPPASATTPAPAAAPSDVPATSATGSLVAPSASASAPSPAPDRRSAKGPDHATSWHGHADDDVRRVAKTCGPRRDVVVACHVPPTDAERIKRADAPIAQCPAHGPLFDIPCAGCGDRDRLDGSGALMTRVTTVARQMAPSACCYAGCMPLPPPPPPNAGRPLVVGVGVRLAALWTSAAWT